MVSVTSLGAPSWPQQIPTVRTQAVTAGKTSQAVSRANAGTEVTVVPAGTEGLVQPAHDTSTLPPVDPTGAAQSALVHKDGASPERSGEATLPTTSLGNLPQGASGTTGTPGAAAENGHVHTKNHDATVAGTQDQNASGQGEQKAAAPQQRFPGELPPAYQSPDQKAMEEQINNFVPNLWKASAAAVTPPAGEGAKSGTVGGYSTPQPGEASKHSSGSVLNMRV